MPRCAWAALVLLALLAGCGLTPNGGTGPATSNAPAASGAAAVATLPTAAPPVPATATPAAPATPTPGTQPSATATAASVTPAAAPAERDCLPLAPGSGLGRPLAQALDGAISGCFRVGLLPPGGVTLVLEAAPLSVLSGAAAGPADTMVLSPAHGPPGATVTISGQVAGAPPAAIAGRQDDHVTVCWAGCATGLHETATVRWSAGAPGHFETELRVPSTAWLGADGPHPLQSGAYTVEIACIPPQFGATKPAGCAGRDLTATFHLEAPAADRCAAGQPCATLRLSPAAAAPGEVVRVAGWAPLTELTDRPFGYYLAFQQGAMPSSKNPAWRPVALAPTAFSVAAAPAWFALGPVRPLWLERSGAPPIATVAGDPRRLAYCAPAGIRRSTDGGATWSTVPIAAARAASAATAYPIFAPGAPNAASTAPPACQSVALDPGHAGVLYAGFVAARTGLSPPPLFSVGYRSADGGRTWQPLPVPAGQDMGGFAGIALQGGGVLAFFAPPLGSATGGEGGAEQSVDGGATWAPGTLACPAAGPCLRFGAEQVGNCAKFGSPQTIEYSADGGARWQVPVWPDRVNACGLHELAGLADGQALLLGDDVYPLLRSGDGGHTWQAVALPPLQLPPDAAPGFPGLQMLPDGSLLAGGANWQLLAPGAASWCPLSAGSVPSMSGWPQVIGDRLWWLQGGPTAGDPARPLTAASTPLSGLRCVG